MRVYSMGSKSIPVYCPFCLEENVKTKLILEKGKCKAKYFELGCDEEKNIKLYFSDEYSKDQYKLYIISCPSVSCEFESRLHYSLESALADIKDILVLADFNGDDASIEDSTEESEPNLPKLVRDK